MTHNALSWFVVGLWHDRRTRNSREVRFDIHSLWTVRERGENSRTLDRTVDQIRELTGRKRHRGIGCIALARCRLFDKKKNEAWRNRKTAREQKKVQNEWKRMKKSQRQYGVFYNYTNEPILSAFISWSLNATQVFAQAYDKRTVYISVDHVFHVYTNALMRTARDNCSRKKKKKKYLLSQRQIREAFTLNDFPLAIRYFNWPNRSILRCRASFYTISGLRTTPYFC